MKEYMPENFKLSTGYINAEKKSYPDYESGIGESDNIKN